MSLSTGFTPNVSQVVASWNSPAPLQVKFAKIAATDTVQDVVAAVAGYKIRVLYTAFTLNGNEDNTIEFLSGGGIGTGTSLSGALLPNFVVTAAGGSGNLIVLTSPWGLFETVAGEKLSVDCGGTTPVASGFLLYCEVPAYTAL